MSDILNVIFKVVIQDSEKAKDYSRTVTSEEQMPHMCDILRPMIDDFLLIDSRATIKT